MPLWLRSLPVPHPVTHKMQPTYGQPSRPMWHCALTAKVLLLLLYVFNDAAYVIRRNESWEQRVLGIGFCHTGPISLCIDSSVFMYLYSVFFRTAYNVVL